MNIFSWRSFYNLPYNPFMSELQRHLKSISRTGGRAKSDAKKKSSRLNAVKAYQARFPHRPLPPRLQQILRDAQR